MPYEKQPDALPTNKSLTAAAIGAGFMLHVEPVVAEFWPEIAPAWAAGPAATDAAAWCAGFFAALLVAWWVPDRAGVSNA